MNLLFRSPLFLKERCKMNKFLHSLRRIWYSTWYKFMVPLGFCYCGKPFDEKNFPFCSEKCMIKFGKEMK